MMRQGELPEGVSVGRNEHHNILANPRRYRTLIIVYRHSDWIWHDVLSPRVSMAEFGGELVEVAVCPETLDADAAADDLRWRWIDSLRLAGNLGKELDDAD